MLMTNDVQIAGRIIEKAVCDHGFEMSKKKLHKLAYYVQAWSLALRGEPAFSGRIEAWRDGPVARQLRAETYQISCAELLDAVVDADLEFDESLDQVISLVVAEKGALSERELVEQTHLESPWLDARGNLGEEDPGDEEITHAAMEQFIFDHGTLSGLTADQLISLRYAELQHSDSLLGSGEDGVASVEPLDRSADRYVFSEDSAAGGVIAERW